MFVGKTKLSYALTVFILNNLDPLSNDSFKKVTFVFNYRLRTLFPIHCKEFIDPQYDVTPQGVYAAVSRHRK